MDCPGQEAQNGLVLQRLSCPSARATSTRDPDRSTLRKGPLCLHSLWHVGGSDHEAQYLGPSPPQRSHLIPGISALKDTTLDEHSHHEKEYRHDPDPRLRVDLTTLLRFRRFGKLGATTPALGPVIRVPRTAVLTVHLRHFSIRAHPDCGAILAHSNLQGKSPLAKMGTLWYN